MTTALFLLLGCVAVAGAVRQTGQVRHLLARKTTLRRHIPKAMGVVMVTAQVSELVRMVQHLSIITIAATLLLLAILLANKAGTEDEKWLSH